MLNELLKNKLWTLGIIVVFIGIILSQLIPTIFLSFELILGIFLVLIGIIMIYQIFKPENTYHKFKEV